MKAYELRKQTKAELTKQLADLKQELASLRVQKTSSGSQTKVSQIGVVRKDIARVLTVMTQLQRSTLREHYRNAKYIPLDLRPKKTRAIRRRLTAHEKGLKTLRQMKKDMNFPARNFCLSG